ncbi:MAG: MGMT family protein [Caldilineaceae bacterium]|nr:MGMT family protein [Caldilineaceae bacterium]
MTDPLSKPVYQRIIRIARLIPRGQVATYGQIAWIEGHCTPRMVGYAMAGLPAGSGVPWQRVINSQGQISPRGDMSSTLEQRRLLEEEGIEFDAEDAVDLRRYGWEGPDPEWLTENGFAVGMPYRHNRRRRK